MKFLSFLFSTRGIRKNAEDALNEIRTARHVKVQLRKQIPAQRNGEEEKSDRPT